MQFNKLIIYVALFSYGNARSQCNELFFSEYVEGYYNNKALEVYNPIGNAVDLSNYRITTWHNGVNNFVNAYCDTLTGIIPGNSVKVFVINKRDSTATGLDTIVSAALRKKANFWLSSNKYASMSLNFNGDDPVTLEKKISGSGWQIVDIIGRVGEQPQLSGSPSTTIGWSDSAPYTNGKGIIYTKDHTLIRKATVISGVNVNPAFFNPKSEWVSYKVNMFDSLGSHHCNCSAYPAAVRSRMIVTTVLFPNPVGDEIMLRTACPVSEPEVFNLQGKQVDLVFSAIEKSGVSFLTADVTSLPSGFYLLKLRNKNGESEVIKFLKQ